MKKSLRNQKSTLSSGYLNVSNKFSNFENINLDGVGAHEKDDIEMRLKEIDSKIEDLGKICDKKKQKSYEDYNNVLKSNKSQFLDELTKLNFKLIETIKQNTREDFMQKLKKDLSSIKNQVYEKDKELQANNNKLYVLENKLKLLKEEKKFFSIEIKNSKQYNLYLKNKLRELENNPMVETKVRNEPSFDNTSRILKSTYSPVNNKENEEEKKGKLELFLTKNEEIYTNKIFNEEKGMKQKYTKLKFLESFKNQVSNTLEEKVREYKFNQMNSKVSNQEVFFNVPESDISGQKTTKKRLFKSKNDRSFSWDYGMTKTDKKEIIKNFLEDEQTKKFLHGLLFDI